MIKKLSCYGFILMAASSAFALDPLPDRARLSSMSAELLLPDRTYLNVDMSFDCDSNFANVSMIVTSEDGAKILAEAYRTLWGEKWAKRVLDTWYNKVNELDPRKPTFIIVTMPSKKYGDGLKSNKLRSAAIDGQSADAEIGAVPTIIGACGTREHDPNGG